MTEREPTSASRHARDPTRRPEARCAASRGWIRQRRVHRGRHRWPPPVSRRHGSRRRRAPDDLADQHPKPDDPLGGNRITLIRFPVPVADRDPASRSPCHGAVVPLGPRRALRSLHQRDRAGRSTCSRGVVGSMLKHVDFVASDVPGFAFPIYLAGAASSGRRVGRPSALAVNLSLLSYDGVCASASDRHRRRGDPMSCECCREGFEEVLALGGAHPTAACRCAIVRSPRPVRHPTASSVTGRTARGTPEPTRCLLPLHRGRHHAHAHCVVRDLSQGPAPEYGRVPSWRSPTSSTLVPRYRQTVRFVPAPARAAGLGRRPTLPLGVPRPSHGPPTTGGDAELKDLMGRLMSQELDRHRPLWEAWMVEALAAADGR